LSFWYTVADNATREWKSPHVEAALDLPLALGVQVRIREDVARGLDGNGVLSRVGQAEERSELLAVQRLVAGLSVRDPDLQLVERPELGPAVRGGGLGIVEELVDVGVVGALLRQHAAGHEETLVEKQQLLLSEQRQCVGPLPVLDTLDAEPRSTFC